LLAHFRSAGITYALRFSALITKKGGWYVGPLPRVKRHLARQRCRKRPSSQAIQL